MNQEKGKGINCILTEIDSTYLDNSIQLNKRELIGNSAWG